MAGEGGRTRPMLDHKGRQLPAGARGPAVAGDGTPAARVPNGHKARGKRRPCANCGRSFQPTVKRRMLCGPCYGRGTGSPFEP